jgi:hypothetical protein
MESGKPGGESQPPMPTLDELLAAAARPAPLAREAEERAVAAFRAARDAGAPSAPTRRADDWRPAGPRVRTGRIGTGWFGTGWIKAGLGTLVAGLTLGGVAMAAGAIPAPFGGTGDTHGPTPGESSRQGEQSPGSGPSASSTAGPDARTPGERPPTAKDQLAHCRVYESRQGQSRAALDATAWQRLEEAAGGPDAVAAYCARLLRETPPQQPSKERPSKSPDGKPEAPPTPAEQRNGRDRGQAL